MGGSMITHKHCNVMTGTHGNGTELEGHVVHFCIDPKGVFREDHFFKGYDTAEEAAELARAFDKHVEYKLRLERTRIMKLIKEGNE